MRAVVLILIMLPLAAFAQVDSDTEYQREALRVNYGFFSTSIVKGNTDEKIAGIGMFGGDVDFLSQRDDEIGVKFRSYNNKRVTGGLLIIAGILASVGAIAAIDDDYGADDNTSLALTIGAFSFFIGGAVAYTSAHNDLSRSLWMYNGTLETRAP